MRAHAAEPPARRPIIHRFQHGGIVVAAFHAGLKPYVRGSIAGDWAVLPEHQLQEVSPNILAVTIPIQPGDYQFKVADAGWTGATNCGGSENPTPVPLSAALTLGCSNGSQNLAITIATAGDYKFTFDATGADKGAPKVTVAKATGGGGGDGGGGGEPEDSTIIRIYAKDVLTAGSAVTLLKTVKGLGQLDVDELRQGGASRITRIEIENKIKQMTQQSMNRNVKSQGCPLNKKRDFIRLLF